MAKLAVQHFVLTKFTRQYGRPLASDLHYVTSYQAVPAHTEFPYRAGQVELFVRYFVTDLPPTKVRITVDWDGVSNRRRVYNAVADVNLLPVVGAAVIDRTYKLVNLSYPGEGTYAVRLWRRRKTWRGRRWHPLATEYFWVERTP